MKYRSAQLQFSARVALLSLTLALGACSNLPWQKPTADASIEQLSKDHRYVSALKTLDATKPRAPDYEQRRAAIVADAHRYQVDLLQQSNALMQQQQFAKAQTLIDNDRAELPASPELAQFDAQFKTARDRYVQRWLNELVQLRAPMLIKEHKNYQALAKAADTPELQGAVARHQADVDYLAPLIAALGSQALAQNDYGKAAQLLSIANQLAPSPTLAQQLKSAEQALAANKQKQQIARSTEREQRYRDLYDALQKSMQDHEFFAARDVLSQARALNIHNDELDGAQRELDDAIASFVNQQIETGNRAYIEGHIEEALQNWQTADALTPTPELKEKIDKAQKFIDRLQLLQKPAK